MSIRHNCESSGCYIKKQTPDWGFLDNSFSGKIKISDMDGMVEANGHLLILEWKREGVAISDGQRIMFEKITTNSRITVYVIFGDPEYSIPKHIKIYKDGVIVNDKECAAENLKNYCTYWEKSVRELITDN
ncbi:MAG: hypothetical protein GOV02_01720 [Candidatus Aenigmarchaeota archaeon]|nr:hypothetical protein [Candidatus Aenigmarchaeota archaeon]